MKKLLIIATVASLSALSSFGQGYFSLGGPSRGSWDIFTPANAGAPKLAATMNIAIFWGSVSATPLVESSLLSGLGSPTNNQSAYLNNPWTAILADGAFQRVVDNNTTLAVQPTTASNSSWAYTTTGGFTSVPVTGTAIGTAVHMYVIGWDKNFATVALAAANGAAVGYSSVFTYTPVDQIGTPSSLLSSGLVHFGVNPVPEPATFALAGLGMAAMLVSRRRK